MDEDARNRVYGAIKSMEGCLRVIGIELERQLKPPQPEIKAGMWVKPNNKGSTLGVCHVNCLELNSHFRLVRLNDGSSGLYSLDHLQKKYHIYTFTESDLNTVVKCWRNGTLKLNSDKGADGTVWYWISSTFSADYCTSTFECHETIHEAIASFAEMSLAMKCFRKDMGNV